MKKYLPSPKTLAIFAGGVAAGLLLATTAVGASLVAKVAAARGSVGV